MKPMPELMHIHSLGGKMAEAVILDKVGDNRYIAEYNGVKCTAILDDIYGVLDGKPQERSHPSRRQGLER